MNPLLMLLLHSGLFGNLQGQGQPGPSPFMGGGQSQQRSTQPVAQQNPQGQAGAQQGGGLQGILMLLHLLGTLSQHGAQGGQRSTQPVAQQQPEQSNPLLQLLGGMGGTPATQGYRGASGMNHNPNMGGGTGMSELSNPGMGYRSGLFGGGGR